MELSSLLGEEPRFKFFSFSTTLIALGSSALGVIAGPAYTDRRAEATVSWRESIQSRLYVLSRRGVIYMNAGRTFIFKTDGSEGNSFFATIDASLMTIGFLAQRALISVSPVPTDAPSPQAKLLAAASTHLLLCLGLFLAGAILTGIAFTVLFVGLLFFTGLGALLSCHLFLLTAWIRGDDAVNSQKNATWVLSRIVSAMKLLRVVLRASLTADFVGTTVQQKQPPRPRARTLSGTIVSAASSTASALASTLPSTVQAVLPRGQGQIGADSPKRSRPSTPTRTSSKSSIGFPSSSKSTPNLNMEAMRMTDIRPAHKRSISTSETRPSTRGLQSPIPRDTFGPIWILRAAITYISKKDRTI